VYEHFCGPVGWLTIFPPLFVKRLVGIATGETMVTLMPETPLLAGGVTTYVWLLLLLPPPPPPQPASATDRTQPTPRIPPTFSLTDRPPCLGML
jgi:hypothetical protein